MTKQPSITMSRLVDADPSDLLVAMRNRMPGGGRTPPTRPQSAAPGWPWRLAALGSVLAAWRRPHHEAEPVSTENKMPAAAGPARSTLHQLIGYARRYCHAGTFGFAALLFGWILGHGPYPDHMLEAAKLRDTQQYVVTADPNDIPRLRRKPIPDEVRVIIRPAGGPAVEAFSVVPAQNKADGAGLLTLTASNVRLRTKPGMEGKVISIFPTGEQFRKLEERGDWIKVRHTGNGLKGWMSAQFLNVRG